jgi:CheY-like chemotaxis protein
VFTRLCGYEVDEFLQLPLEAVVQLVHADDRAPVSAAMEDALASPLGTPCQIDYRLRARDDHYVWLRDQFTLFCDEDGQRAFIGSVQDVSLMKYADAERAALEVRNRQLEKAESLGRMASSVAHLFNNHLQAVVSHLELVENKSGQDRHEHLLMSQVSLAKAIEVSQLLLTYLGQTPGDREFCSWTELCREAFGEWSKAHRELTDAWQVDLPEPGPLVFANSRLLRFALGHVLTNAREAQAGYLGRLRLATALVPADAVGASHRFPVGWQPTQASYAVKGIIHAHDGVLTVTSRPGIGTTVSLYLPLAQGALIRTPEVATVSPVATGFNPPSTGTVLFTDDDEALREVTGELITLVGYEVVTASGGLEAVELLKVHGDAIICAVTDLSMPDIDGWQTMEMLKALRPDLPVVPASGFDRSRALAKAIFR